MNENPEPSRIEVDAENAGMSVPDFFVKKFNAIDASEGAPIRNSDIVAKIDSGGYEYRITVNLPKEEVTGEEINAMLGLANKYDSLFFLAMPPKKRALQAVFIWDRPVEHPRIGDVGPER